MILAGHRFRVQAWIWSCADGHSCGTVATKRVLGDGLDHWLDKNICIANVTTGIGMSTGFAFAEDVVQKLYQ